MRLISHILTMLLVSLALGAWLSPTMAMPVPKQTTITYWDVHHICGADQESYGGDVGCTKPCGKTICDYNCNEKDGCKKTVLWQIQPGAGGGSTKYTIAPVHAEVLQPQNLGSTFGSSGGDSQSFTVHTTSAGSIKAVAGSFH